jgi:Protein of unknown function (DUF5132)
MQKTMHEGHDAYESPPDETAETGEKPAANGAMHNEVVATAATVAVVGVGAVLFEAALLPGIVLGVAAMWAPQYFPKVGAALNPLFRSSVRGAYKVGQKTREMFAEAHEQVHDIVAEVHAENDTDEAPAKPVGAASTATH